MGSGGDEGECLHIADSHLVAGDGAGEYGEAGGGHGFEQLKPLHGLGEGVLDVFLGGLGFDVDGCAVLVAEVLHDVVDLFGGGYVYGDQLCTSAF